MEITKAHVNTEVQMRTVVGAARTTLVLAAKQSAAFELSYTRWPICVSDVVLRDSVCRGYSMFHETITFYSNKNKPGANMVKRQSNGRQRSVHEYGSAIWEVGRQTALQSNHSGQVRLYTRAYELIADVLWKTPDFGENQNFNLN